MSDGCCGKWKKTGKFCDDCPIRKKLSKEARKELVLNFQSKQREQVLLEKAIIEEKKIAKINALSEKHGIELKIEDFTGKKWEKKLKQITEEKKNELKKAEKKLVKAEKKSKKIQSDKDIKDKKDKDKKDKKIKN